MSMPTGWRVAGDASVTIQDSTVGALSLAAKRPDLATSQIRVSGRGRADFTRVRFDCGIVALDDAVSQSVTRSRRRNTPGVRGTRSFSE